MINNTNLKRISCFGYTLLFVLVVNASVVVVNASVLLVNASVLLMNGSVLLLNASVLLKSCYGIELTQSSIGRESDVHIHCCRRRIKNIEDDAFRGDPTVDIIQLEVMVITCVINVQFFF